MVTWLSSKDRVHQSRNTRHQILPLEKKVMKLQVLQVLLEVQHQVLSYLIDSPPSALVEEGVTTLAG
jgi:hypothetical protein